MEPPALSAQTAAMVRSDADVLAPLGAEPVLQACVAARRTAPIVFMAINYDPIARGYVQSLAKPSSNVTGVFPAPDRTSGKAGRAFDARYRSGLSQHRRCWIEHAARPVECVPPRPLQSPPGLALLWQIYSRRCALQIHFRQCGHRCGGSRAKSSMMA
ncbi:MAG: ABC transporter substrate binding protein [Terriglobales bacterium]